MQREKEAFLINADIMMGPTVDLCPLGMLIKAMCVCVCVEVGWIYLAAQPDKPGILDNHIFMCEIIICLLLQTKMNSADIPFSTIVGFYMVITELIGSLRLAAPA